MAKSWREKFDSLSNERKDKIVERAKELEQEINTISAVKEYLKENLKIKIDTTRIDFSRKRVIISLELDGEEIDSSKFEI